MSHMPPAFDIDTRSLRNVLGTFATGIVIATTNDQDGHPTGLAVSSFNSLSLDPALVLWSIGLNSSSLAAFRRSSSFAINVLSVDQQLLCMQFARSGGDKFKGIEFTRGLEGLPLLHGAAAHLQCRTVQRYPGGDHELYVGQVMALANFEREPLIFHNGRYASSKPLAAQC